MVVLLTVFFDCNGVMHHEFLPQGLTVNKVMSRLREANRLKGIELWKNHSWSLIHDKAPAYTFMLVHEFLAKNKTVIMLQPPYSSDLAPANFLRFPKLKTPMKGKRFTTIEEIKDKLKQKQLAIRKCAFPKCFED